MNAPDTLAEAQRSTLWRTLPLLAKALCVGLAWLALGECISFDALADTREAVIELRDAQYVTVGAAGIATFTLMFGFSLARRIPDTLAGGFLFETHRGALFNLAGATPGVPMVFLAARTGIGARVATRLAGSAGLVTRTTEGIDASQGSMLLLPAIPVFRTNPIPASRNAVLPLGDRNFPRDHARRT